MKFLNRSFFGLVALGASSVAALGQTSFEVTFDQLTSRAELTGVPGTPSAEPEVEAVLTRSQNGRTGEAAIIASEALESFGPLAGEMSGSLIEPGRGIRYFCTEVLNPEAGEIHIAFLPSYNGSYPVIEGSSPSRLYYLFDSGAASPNGPSERVGGIQLLIKHVKGGEAETYMLNASLTLASGEVVKMARPVGATPEQWHTVTLRWKDGVITLEFDEKRVAQAEAKGPLAPFQEFFTIGGSWYGTWPLQGLVDDVRILGGQ